MAGTGHLQTIEQELRALLDEGDTEKIVKTVKTRVLESYRNGQAAKGESGKDTPQGKPYQRKK